MPIAISILFQWVPKIAISQSLPCLWAFTSSLGSVQSIYNRLRFTLQILPSSVVFPKSVCFVLFCFPVMLLQNDHSLYMTLTSLCCSIFVISWSLSDLGYGCWMALLSLNFWMVVGFGNHCPFWVKTEKDNLHWTHEV